MPTDPTPIVTERKCATCEGLGIIIIPNKPLPCPSCKTERWWDFALEMTPHTPGCVSVMRGGRNSCVCDGYTKQKRNRIAAALAQVAAETREECAKTQNEEHLALVAEYQRVMEAMVLNAHEPDKWPMELSQMVKMPKTLRELLERRAAAILKGGA